MGSSATVGTEQQHLRTLEYANRVRLARARMKRRIAAGELSVVDVVLDCPWEAHSMSISDLLMAQRRWGRTRCRRVLMSLGVSEIKKIGTLTERQRMALAAALSAKGDAEGQTARSRRPAPEPEAAPLSGQGALSAA